MDKYEKLSNSLQKVEQGKIPVSEYFGDLIEAGRSKSEPEWLTEADIKLWGVAYNKLAEHFKNNPRNFQSENK